MSQSLLFRSVFPFGILILALGGLAYVVAIPSIQVGFSIPSVKLELKAVKNLSQSLLFRSVFPFPAPVTDYAALLSSVAIPSIQVGFSIRNQ